MPPEAAGPLFLWRLFSDLRRRKFPLGISDYDDLRTALRLGFGWSSQEELVELCCTLWAKSPRDAEIIRALFTQFEAPEWQLAAPEAAPTSMSPPSMPPDTPPTPAPTTPPTTPDVDQPSPAPVTVEKKSGLPPISLADVQLPASHLTFVPRFPLTYREAAQAWRRVRTPARFGPRTEIDLDATLARASRTGVPAGPVLVPPRRNTSRLLLLIDSMGSMTPFRSFTREIAQAILSAGAAGRAGQFYFHDTPAEGSLTLSGFTLDGLYPRLDALLTEIAPLATGYLYEDEELTRPRRIADVYETCAAGANVVILSDGGAARHSYDFQRLLDTVASLKYLRAFSRRIVWLNPLPEAAWARTTAEQIARHVPMFPLDAESLGRAVAALKAEHFELERGL